MVLILRYLYTIVLHVGLVAVLPAQLMSEARPVKSAAHRCPEDPGEYPDPKGRYVMACHPAETKESVHRLVLARRDGAVIRTMRLERHGLFVWSPTGIAVAITDAHASNESTCLVVFPDDASRVIEPTTQMVDNARDGWRGHWYCDVQRWLGPDRLLLKVWGYGDDSRQPFERRYVYRVGKGLMELRRR